MDAFIWLFKAFLCVIPYWITKFFIIDTGELLIGNFWGEIFEYLKCLLKTSLLVLFTLFNRSSEEEINAPETELNLTYLCTYFIVICVTTFIGFYIGNSKVKKNKEIEYENNKATALLYNKNKEIENLNLRIQVFEIHINNLENDKSS